MTSKLSGDGPTTVTRLTSLAPSAIAVLEINGPQALDFVNRCWQPNRGDERLHLDAVRFGFTRSEGQAEGESIVVCRTGEHRVEMHCHGGRFASECILDTLLSFGAIERPANLSLAAEGFDLIAAEAREDLLSASTQRTTAILLDQFRGALQREFDTIQSLLASGSTDEAIQLLNQLNGRSRVGQHLVHPWRVVLAGPPNSGKSSLLNFLLGYSRAIVHDQAGTTRDLLAEYSSFDGWPIELIDSAGIRNASDAIEAAGIESALDRISTADCTVLLVDLVTGWTDTHTQILNHCNGKVVFVGTKSDLVPVSNMGLLHLPISVSNLGVKPVFISSVTGKGLNELMSAVVSVLVPKPLIAGDAVPFRPRHIEMIAEALSDARGTQTI